MTANGYRVWGHDSDVLQRLMVMVYNPVDMPKTTGLSSLSR